MTSTRRLKNILRGAAAAAGRRLLRRGRGSGFWRIEVLREGFPFIGWLHGLPGAAAAGEHQAEHQDDPQQKCDAVLSHLLLLFQYEGASFLISLY